MVNKIKIKNIIYNTIKERRAIMEKLLFNVYERLEKGRKVRKHGEIPCVIYGEDSHKTISAKMSKKEMYRMLGYPKSSVISLDLNGDIKKCIVKEIQKDIYGKVAHIDFQCIRKGELVRLRIPLTFVGQGALESKGLLLETFISEVELQGEPSKFPRHIEVDVSQLNSGSQVFVRDLPIPNDVTLDTNEDLSVAKIDSINYADESDEETTAE